MRRGVATVFPPVPVVAGFAVPVSNVVSGGVSEFVVFVVAGAVAAECVGGTHRLVFVFCASNAVAFAHNVVISLW